METLALLLLLLSLWVREGDNMDVVTFVFNGDNMESMYNAVLAAVAAAIIPSKPFR